MGEYANKAVGKTKKAVGSATDNRDLEAEGRVQETAGKVQGGVKKGARKVEDAIDDVGRGINESRKRPPAQRPARTHASTEAQAVQRR